MGGQPQHPRPRRHAGHHDPPHVAALICLRAGAWLAACRWTRSKDVWTLCDTRPSGEWGFGVRCPCSVGTERVRRHCWPPVNPAASLRQRVVPTGRRSFVACQLNPPDDRHGVTKKEMARKRVQCDMAREYEFWVQGTQGGPAAEAGEARRALQCTLSLCKLPLRAPDSTSRNLRPQARDVPVCCPGCHFTALLSAEFFSRIVTVLRPIKSGKVVCDIVDVSNASTAEERRQ